jgi:hypothetical protein
MTNNNKNMTNNNKNITNNNKNITNNNNITNNDNMTNNNNYLKEQLNINNLTDLNKKVNKINDILIKDILQDKWPRITKECKQTLNLMLQTICQLSQIGKNEEAFSLIENYSFSALIRCLAINKVADNSGKTSGKDLMVINNDEDKLKLYKQTNITNYTRHIATHIRQVGIPKSDGGIRILSIGNKIDCVLQTQLCILLDSFYESKYSEYMYGFRKGRNALQALGLLQDVINRSDKSRLGIGLLDIKACFDNFSHDTILLHFKVPKKWENHLKNWIKATIWNEKGSNIGKLQKGIPQGSIIGPMICNVLLNITLYQQTENKLSLFTGLKTNFTDLQGKRHVIYRKIIVFADDITITTTNAQELPVLIQRIEQCLNKIGLNLSLAKTQLLYYNILNKIKFDLLGFTFLYVPYNKIKKSGILTSSSTINKKTKKAITINNTGGTHLIYPSEKSFKNIKLKVKTIIKELNHLTVFEVVRNLNLILKGWINYFAWSLASKRLSQLDHYIFKIFKKQLIKKFRKRGIFRIKWVMNEFFLCSTDKNDAKNIKSPYLRKWHLHVKYPETQNNQKRLKDMLWLLLCTKTYKIIPISDNALSPRVRKLPYYFATTNYINSHLKILASRMNSFDYKKQLYLKQKGICPECNSPLFLQEFNSENNLTWLNEEYLELHHVKPIAVGNKLSKKEHMLYNKKENLVLLHKECHYNLTYQI